MKNKDKVPVPTPLRGPKNPMRTFPVDPMGSYTGRPMLPDEEPVQDADDL